MQKNIKRDLKVCESCANFWIVHRDKDEKRYACKAVKKMTNNLKTKEKFEQEDIPENCIYYFEMMVLEQTKGDKDDDRSRKKKDNDL